MSPLAKNCSNRCSMNSSGLKTTEQYLYSLHTTASLTMPMSTTPEGAQQPHLPHDCTLHLQGPSSTLSYLVHFPSASVATHDRRRRPGRCSGSQRLVQSCTDSLETSDGGAVLARSQHNPVLAPAGIVRIQAIFHRSCLHKDAQGCQLCMIPDPHLP